MEHHSGSSLRRVGFLPTSNSMEMEKQTDSNNECFSGSEGKTTRFPWKRKRGVGLRGGMAFAFLRLC